MTQIGIDKMGLYVPHYYLDLKDLAHARGEDPDKFVIGIGQDKMAVPSMYEDVVSLAANAGSLILSEGDRDQIDQVFVASESAFDQSKSLASYLVDLLDLRPHTRVVEFKQACYSGTAALQLACDYVSRRPSRKVLVITSDISRYGLASPGEVTQGAGSIAMIVSQDPGILALDKEAVYLSENAYDFWRPSYLDHALVDGKFSTELYLSFFRRLFKDYQLTYPKRVSQTRSLLFHLPFTKIASKAYRAIEDLVDSDLLNEWQAFLPAATHLNRNVGNIYTGSLYMSLVSLLVYADNIKAGDHLTLFSYGSGAMGELFSGQVQKGFRKRLSQVNQAVLDHRLQMSVKDYEESYLYQMNYLSDSFTPPPSFKGYYLKEVNHHQRNYGYR